MTPQDLARHWQLIAIRADDGRVLQLKDAYAICLGVAGTPGSPFAEYVYFVRDLGPKGRRLDLLKVGADESCEALLSTGPDGFKTARIGKFMLET